MLENTDRIFHKASIEYHLSFHLQNENGSEVFASTKENSDRLFNAIGRNIVIVFTDWSENNYSTGDTGNGMMSATYMGYDELIADVYREDIESIIWNDYGFDGDIIDFIYSLNIEDSNKDFIASLVEDNYFLFQKASECEYTKEFLNF